MEIGVVAARILVGLAGLAVVLFALTSSITTVILPRALSSFLTRGVFRAVRFIYELAIGRGATYERRDRMMASYGPVALLTLLAVWVMLILGGFTGIFLSLGHTLFHAFQLSGSAIVTLGFAGPTDVGTTIAVVVEAFLGLVELALLITYLPSLYGAFQRRERLVSKLEVRAGSPPSGVELLLRFYDLERLAHLTQEVWEPWEDWFIDVAESQTSLPALSFFRSPVPQRSWITAAGAVLDAAALNCSALDVPRNPHAELCIEAGETALKGIAAYFGIDIDLEPAADSAVSVSRQEFEEAVARMREAGLPTRDDLDRAWRDFRRWRVSYDQSLVELAALVNAPYAIWSSDRGVFRRRRAAA